MRLALTRERLGSGFSFRWARLGSVGLGSGAVEHFAGGLQAGDALGQSLSEGFGQALGAVEHDHLVNVSERLGRRLDDGRSVLGELLADHRVLVAGEGLGAL